MTSTLSHSLSFNIYYTIYNTSIYFLPLSCKFMNEKAEGDFLISDGWLGKFT